MKLSGKTQIFLPTVANLFIYGLQHLLLIGYIQGDISIVDEAWGPTITGTLLIAFAVYVVANIVAGIICGLKATSMVAVLYWLIGFLITILCNYIYCPANHLTMQASNIPVALLQGTFQIFPFILITLFVSDRNREALLKEKKRSALVLTEPKKIIDLFNSRDFDGLKTMFGEEIENPTDLSFQIENAFEIVKGTITGYDVALRCDNDETIEYIIKNVKTDTAGEYEFCVMTDMKTDKLLNIWIFYAIDGIQKNTFIGNNPFSNI
ncbi:MAG: hypothetical protein J6D27_09380 [Ruminiclostridium sp.]|nr:hypothetical protein [Ruminiclostridium sp.]